MEERQLSIPFDEFGIFRRRRDDEAFQAKEAEDGEDDQPVCAHYSCEWLVVNGQWSVFCCFRVR